MARCRECNCFLTKDEIAMFGVECGDCVLNEGMFAIQPDDREEPQVLPSEIFTKEVLDAFKEGASFTTPAKDNNPIEPSHYTDMEISPLEFIEVNMDVLTWCTMNVIKYVGRHQRKNGLEDLKKAQWYLNHEIERLEND